MCQRQAYLNYQLSNYQIVLLEQLNTWLLAVTCFVICHNVIDLELCDGGGEELYHLQCLDPPLLEIPPGEWLCCLCYQNNNNSENENEQKPVAIMTSLAAAAAATAAKRTVARTKIETETKSNMEL